jgi:general stress protein YciG
MEEIPVLKGGQATQQGSEQSGRDNSGQFEEGSQEASEAGKMGGSNS